MKELIGPKSTSEDWQANFDNRGSNFDKVTGLQSE